VKTTHLLLAPRVKTPEEAWRDEPVWYLDSNRGINEIGKTVQKAVAQLDPGFVGAHVPKKAHQTVPKLTNYSSRVTCITNAMAAGCSDAEVKQITGHKSDCFRGYQRPSTAACVMREHIKLGKVTDVMSPEGARQGIASSTAPPRLPAPAASAPSPPTRTPSLLDGRPGTPRPLHLALGHTNYSTPPDVSTFNGADFNSMAPEFMGRMMRAFMFANGAAPPS